MRRAAILVVLLAGCRTGRPDTPALLVAPTAESRAALSRAVSDALGGRAVTLADDALEQDSALIIERAQHRDAAGLPVTGRDYDRPERFTLMKEDGGACVLVHARTGKRTRLAAECEAYSPVKR